jgi:hypothetical protein
MATRQQIDVRAVLILAALFIAVWIGWDTPLVYPIKIFVVFLHELGHALAALLTGGQVVSIQIFPDEGGLTATRGGWPLVILSAGYVGSLLLGGVLLYLSSRRIRTRWLLVALGALLALSTVLFLRNVFAILYGLLAAAALFFCAYRFAPEVNLYVIRFIAVASCLYALLDMRSDLFTSTPAAAGVVTDAVALSQLTGIPALVWSVLWLVISLIAAGYFFMASIRRGPQKRSDKP